MICDCAIALFLMTVTARAAISAIAGREPEQVRPAENGVERRAQLVGQRGEKLVLEPIGLLGLRAQVALDDEQLLALLFGALAIAISAAARVRFGELRRSCSTRSSSSSCACCRACVCRLSASRF